MSYRPYPLYFYSPAAIVPEIQEGIDSYNKIWISNFHSTSDQLNLYHYTDLSGLKGIIADRAIWCTSIHVLKDNFEIQYGKKLIINQLNNFIEQENDSIVQDTLEEVKGLCNSIGPSGPHRIFIACFCEKNNLSNQWDNYAAKGGGYNLCFSFNTNTVICSDKTKPEDLRLIYLRKVIYDPKKQNDIIQQYIYQLVDGIKAALLRWDRYTEVHGSSLKAIIALSAINLLGDMMISMKDPSYEKEEEWRLIRVLAQNEIPEHYKFRESNNELIPYLNSHLYRKCEEKLIFPLESITYGPMREKIKTRMTLEMFIANSKQLDNVINLMDNISIKDAG